LDTSRDRIVLTIGIFLVLAGIAVYESFQLDLVAQIVAVTGAVLFLVGLVWRPNHDKMIAGGTLFLVLGVLLAVAGLTAQGSWTTNAIIVIAVGLILLVAGIEMVFDPLKVLP
jgi:hypothetical protein